MNGLILCTKECNLRCSYCFEESMRRDKMCPVEQLRKQFDRFIDLHLRKFVEELIAVNHEMRIPKSNICFHGGEPMLVGKELLEKAFRIVHEYPDTEISTQTNATLIDDDIIELYKKYNVHIGISLDGPKSLHDKYRLTIGQTGTFDTIYRNVLKMQKAGLMVGALATITADTVRCPEEFYRFFADLNLNFSFNPLFLAPGQVTDCTGLSQKDFIDFYKKMFDLWINDTTSNISISCFDRILSAIAIKDKPYMEVCTYIPDCSMTTLAITPTGDFYRCLHYCMNEKNRIGNIQTDSLFKALGDENFAKRVEILRNGVCKDCDIFEFCNGGCPYVAEANHGTIMNKDNTCASQRAIVHYIYDYLKGLKSDA